MASSSETEKQWYLKYKTPILFPSHEGFDLSVPQSSFDNLVQDIVRSRNSSQNTGDTDTETETPGLVLPTRTSAETRADKKAIVDPEKSDASNDPKSGKSDHPFIQALVSYNQTGASAEEERELGDNQMLTENGDLAYSSTNSPLVDLFHELEDVVSDKRLNELLNASWKEDPLATLKIIFNARSIHLGKSSQSVFYRCAGWLAQNHPLTLIANLRWLSRPVIQKKLPKEEADSDMVMVNVEPEKNTDDVTRFDVKHGVSHGYWKDLLNILVLGVRGQLDVLVQPKKILYVKRQREIENKDEALPALSKEEAKTKRHEGRDARHKQAISAFDSDPVYRGLYLTVTRLFAEQLKADLALLESEDPKAKKNISLCAKWAPSHDRFHDKHTFIVSSIAEAMYPMKELKISLEDMDRELYIRHARERYRKTLSALRAHLGVVERNMAAKTYEKIKYDRIPSLAMNRYTPIFAVKDTVRFTAYVEGVAEGKISISGATLLPSQLVRSVMERNELESQPKKRTASRVIKDKVVELEAKVADGQWKTLVQRIKDSGTLESSIAVCDVSGSMSFVQFADGTTPMDTAIGLSLLLAEVTAPPFGGHFITFSRRPAVESVDLQQPFSKKVAQLSRAEWEQNTDFAAVFEKLILPMAIKNKLRQEDMVKRVFVFSDMQFDQATMNFEGGWSSSFERIKQQYMNAGYEMPELVFWNLAGGRSGTAPKPVTADMPGTAVVSGYSQAMLKVFLDNGSFDEAGDDEDMTTEEEGDAVVISEDHQAKKQKMDPMMIVRKAIGHTAYDPLQVMD
ncbi:hypothetical protein GGS20DRAFT_411783 [Poronia punctata]|nr:hypothetical protein GGS20DRAFT_411783 [Poronia punctata]